MNWTFHLPTKIEFGLGVRKSRVPSIVAGFRFVFVTDPMVRRLEPVAEMIEQLGPDAVFDGISPNPTVAQVDALAKFLRAKKTEVVLAVGGGSVLDCAKAAACLATAEDSSIRAYHSEGKAFDRRGLALVTMPTTAGTGSEVTPIAVLDDEVKKFKGPMNSHRFHPLYAVVDPELTFSAPLAVTAATALDALSHAIEGYWSNNHQPICDALAKEAASMIFGNLQKVYDDPSCAEGREALSYAALIAGIAFQMPKNAIMHACSYPLSNRAHLPHGTACAFTMEAAIRLNTPFMDGRMEKFAAHCGFGNIEEMIEAITTLKRRGGLPCTLKEAGIEPEMVDTLIQESFHPLMKNNPKEVTEDDLRNIYRGLATNG